MGMCRWEPQMVRFMKDAADGTAYFQTVADWVRGYADCDGYLCDAGCGLGHLGLHLAEQAYRVDCLDKAPHAVAALRAMVAERHVANVRAIVADYSSYVPARRYGTMVFCMSASIEEAASVAMGRCAGKVVVINRVDRKTSRGGETSHTAQVPSLGHPTLESFESKIASLAALGITCEGDYLDVEIGQPFRSLEDARVFFATYRTHDYPDGVTDTELLAMLEKRDDDPWRYYLPLQRHLGLFSFDMDNAMKLASLTEEEQLPDRNDKPCEFVLG